MMDMREAEGNKVGMRETEIERESEAEIEIGKEAELTPSRCILCILAVKQTCRISLHFCLHKTFVMVIYLNIFNPAC